MDATSRAAGGLVNYVRAVADELGDEALEADVSLDDELATVIVLVRSHLPTVDALPVLLTWDEVSGWALRVEVDGSGDTTPLVYMGEDILPEPHLVHRFLQDAVNGENPGTVIPQPLRQPGDNDGLEHRLAHFVA